MWSTFWDVSTGFQIPWPRLSPQSYQKPLGQRLNLVSSSKLEPMIWAHDTDQWITCFDRSHLTRTWMSNLYGVNHCFLSLCQNMATMFHSISFVFCCRVHTPTIHPTSQFDHEKRVPWFSICMRTCGSVPIVKGFRLAAFWVTGAPLKAIFQTIGLFNMFHEQKS